MKKQEPYKKLGESAIHDRGFQFYVTINIAHEIPKLIKEMKAINRCMETHSENKKESSGWYNSRSTAYIWESLEEHKGRDELTLAECKKAYELRKAIYDRLMLLCEDALVAAKKSYARDVQKYDPVKDRHLLELYGPSCNDLERKNVIIIEDQERSSESLDCD